MKKVNLIGLAMMVVVVMASVAAAASVTSFEQYKIKIPGETSSAIAKKDFSGVWYCDSDQLAEVQYEYWNFSVAQQLKGPGASTGRVTLLGETTESDEIRKLEGFINFLPEQKTINITFAGQFCETKWEQVYDYELNKWHCYVEPQLSCQTVEYFLRGELTMTADLGQSSERIFKKPIPSIVRAK